VVNPISTQNQSLLVCPNGVQQKEEEVRDEILVLVIHTGVSSEQGSSALVGSVCLIRFDHIAIREERERTDHLARLNPDSKMILSEMTKMSF